MKKALLFTVAMMFVGAAFAARPSLSQVAVSPLNHSNGNYQKVQFDASKLVNQTPTFEARKFNLSKNLNVKSLKNAVAAEGEEVPNLAYAPLGQFYVGLSPEFIGYSASALLTGAYTNSYWYNISTGATQFQWTWNYYDYIQGSASDDFVSTENHLIVELPYSYLNQPVLSAPSGEDVVSYTRGIGTQVGGNWMENISEYVGSSDPVYTVFGACTYEMDSEDANTIISRAKLMQNGASESYDNLLAKYEMGSSSSIVGYGNFFPAPNRPYYMSEVWFPAFVELPAGTEIGVKVYGVDDEGSVDFSSTLAEGTYTAESDLSSSKAKQNYMIDFPLAVYDPETELMIEQPITIDRAIYIEVELPEDLAAGAINPTVCFVRDEYADSYMVDDCAIAVLNYTDTENNPATLRTNAGMWGYGIWNDTEADAHIQSFLFHTDATFTWLVPETERVQLDVANEPTRVDVNSYFYTTVWTIEEDADMDGVIDNAPWLVYNVGEDETTGDCFIEFAATSVEPRYADVHISVPGSNATIRVIQGNGGVKAVASDAVKVSVAGGNFNIKANAGVNSVAIYTVAGQLVKKAALVAGDNVVPASDLAKGVYVLKFNNNYAVKAVK